MGLFNRKHKQSAEGDDNRNGARDTNPLTKSPSASETMNGSAAIPGLAKIPDITLPKPPDPSLDPAAYLRSIYSVRERSRLVMQKAKKNRLAHFDVDSSKFRDTAVYVCSIIKACISLRRADQ